jgi:hypothetical protein
MPWGRALCGAALLALFVGCAENAKNAEVTGKVTVDGKPLETGAITFFPVDGMGTTAGGTIEAGEYSVPVKITRQGQEMPQSIRMKVTISAPKVVGMKKLYNTEKNLQRPVTAESLPEKYNAKSELTYEVKPGKNEKDWELKSK